MSTSLARLRLSLFGKHLFFTNTALGGGLLALGDLIEQSIEVRVFKSARKYDWKRAGTVFQ